MNRSLHSIPMAPLYARALACGSSERQTLPSLSAGSSRQLSASGMSPLAAQALLTYLRAGGVSDACAIELIGYCAARARAAN